MNAAKALKRWRGKRTLREAASVIREAGAKLGVGCHHTALCHWETGKRCPDIASARLLEKVTGIPASAWPVRRLHVVRGTVDITVAAVNGAPNVQPQRAPKVTAGDRADDDTGLHGNDKVGGPKRRRAAGARS